MHSTICMKTQTLQPLSTMLMKTNALRPSRNRQMQWGTPAYDRGGWALPAASSLRQWARQTAP